MISREFKNKNILITGGAGFIGSHLVDQLFIEGVNRVVVIDNLFCGDTKNLNLDLKRNLIFCKGDAEDQDLLLKLITENNIDYVFNLATKALNHSFHDPIDAFVVNTKITGNLLELLRESKFKTLCHFSSSEVYGTAVYEPMDEKHPLHPTTTYAAGKAAADLLIESYVNMFSLDVITVRPFNNFGPRQNREGPLVGVVPKVIMQLINGKPPTLQGDGTQMRDFIFVKDTVRISLSLFKKMKSGEVVNVCAEKGVMIRELIEKIEKVLGTVGPWRQLPPRAADVKTHIGTMKKARLLTDVSLTSFEEALRETINWYKNEVGAS